MTFFVSDVSPRGEKCDGCCKVTTLSGWKGRCVEGTTREHDRKNEFLLESWQPVCLEEITGVIYPFFEE